MHFASGASVSALLSTPKNTRMQLASRRGKMPSTNDLIPATSGEYELGEIIGSRRAFSTVAGRCTAADAACIKRLRDEKLFKNRCEKWEEFCLKFLGMNDSGANRLIRYLEEFGPEFFQLTQLTRISPKEYRALAPTVKDGALHANG